ncbi:hypothetical protein BD309DRAFT_970122 [Dichomitus squalens]|uniref:Uncharacterized protein n=1 Tax=Dichomitus squalens TaxID=114155 RepID=A0A4V2K8K8_9APHY|nr:hypothetical protein BD309DRAFT_970122 [Dichomitus squalens]TBU60388.1 hypothetical protein BD310DRAFT_947351 [Dichomitus squalens]
MPSTPVTPLHLPTELNRLIVDQLSDDRSSLSSCSLACRAWTGLTRVLIFHTVKLRDFRDAEGYKFVAFLELLEDSHRLKLDVGMYIKELSLNGRHNFQETDEDASASSPLVHTSLRFLISLLPYLQKLTLNTLEIGSSYGAYTYREEDDEDELDEFGPRPGPISRLKLRNLTIRCCTFDRTFCAANLLSMFSRVDHLQVIRSYGLSGDYKEARMTGLVPPTITSFAYDGVDYAAHDLFGLLLEQDPWSNSGTLERVSLRGLGRGGGRTVQLLHHFCHNLVKLDLGLYHLIFGGTERYPTSSWDRLMPAIHSCTSLRSLTLSIGCDSDEEFLGDPLHTCTPEGIRAYALTLGGYFPVLRTVTFNVYSCRVFTAAEILAYARSGSQRVEVWRELDKSLMGLQALKRVSIILHDCPECGLEVVPDSTIRGFVEKKLAGTRSAGKLDLQLGRRLPCYLHERFH